MSTELVIVLTLLVSAVVMFVLNKPRMDAVALIMLAVLPFTGIISMGEALADFSDPNIVLIAGWCHRLSTHRLLGGKVGSVLAAASGHQTSGPTSCLGS